MRGGYSPDVIRVRQGVPVELVFDRQESGDCTSRVVFADLALSAALPAFERTTVRLTPAQAGSFGFACGMNMIHGTLIVDPADRAGRRRPTDRSRPTRQPPAPADGAAAGEGRSAVEVGGRPGAGAAGGDRRPDPPGDRRRGADRAGAVRGDGPRGVRRRLGAGAAAQPLAAAGADHAGDVLHRLADPPHRLARPGAPRRGHEQPDHPRHDRRLRLQPAGHRRPRPAARRRARGVLRGRRGHPHPDPARPAARGPRQGRHRRGDPRAARPAGPHRPRHPRRRRGRDPGRGGRRRRRGA